MTDGPYAETKEQIGGFWVIEAADLDAALDWARKAAAACEGPVEVRPFQELSGRLDSTAALAEVFRREAGRCTATLVRVLGDVDLAEDAVAEAFAIAAERWPATGVPAEPRRLDHHDRPQPGHRPAAPRVDPRPSATSRPTACTRPTTRDPTTPISTTSATSTSSPTTSSG